MTRNKTPKLKKNKKQNWTFPVMLRCYWLTFNVHSLTRSAHGHRVSPSYVPGPEQSVGDTDEPWLLPSWRRWSREAWKLLPKGLTGFKMGKPTMLWEFCRQIWDSPPPLLGGAVFLCRLFQLPGGGKPKAQIDLLAAVFFLVIMPWRQVSSSPALG